MSIFSFFKTTETTSCEIQEIFPLHLNSQNFIKADIIALYVKILTDTIERTHGISKDVVPLLWDNCVQNETANGLVTLLAEAMTERAELFLVYNRSVNILRQATGPEREKIKADYLKAGESKIGVFISFKNYRRTEMLLIYANLEYCVLSSFHKTVNISKAVQIKINDLRASTALADASVAIEQARSIAAAMKNGNDVLLDVKDLITTTTPTIEPTEKAITFLDAKRAFILGLPISYISGLQTPGIGSTGEADMRAVERGLKQYYESIIQPVILALFGDETEFKSQDFRQIASALEMLKTFDLVSDENISSQSKQEISARMFDLDPTEEQKRLKKEAKQREKEDATAEPEPLEDPTTVNSQLKLQAGK